VKQLALQGVIQLERLGRISRKDNYQRLLDMIRLDIRNKHRRRIERRHELSKCRSTVQQLADKQDHLRRQLDTYQTVIETGMEKIQSQNW
jgi:Ras GTPase-activating-like protein IQGAP2/3